MTDHRSNTAALRRQLEEDWVTLLIGWLDEVGVPPTANEWEAREALYRARSGRLPLAAVKAAQRARAGRGAR